MAQGRKPPEKKDLKIGSSHTVRRVPLIMADPLGFYREQGLNVQLMKTAGWALIRDKMLNKEHDASHFLSPMPIAISMGLGSAQQPMRVADHPERQRPGDHAARQAQGQARSEAMEGLQVRRCPSSTRCTISCCATTSRSSGLDPDTDIQIRVTPPPEMVANLRAGNIDGFLGPDPFNQRAVYDGVGFIHMLSKDIWDGHPCCAFAASKDS
jgi:nitrate/nitrite transport system substrate-binding protein